MGIKDVAGISRPGVFEKVPLYDPATGKPSTETTAAPRSGTTRTVNYRAEGSRATQTPDFQGPNVADPYALNYAAETQGAVSAPTFADVWPAPQRAVRRGRG